MNVDTDIDKQVHVAKWIDNNLCIPYSFDGENESWSHICFDLVLEHHSSIITLCQGSLYGSALALLRVELEALVRGLWLRHVASAKEIEKYKNDKIDPNFHELVEQFEGKAGINEGLLSYIKAKQWKIFNSFTHTGIEAVSRRIGEKTTGYDNYKQNDVEKALRFSGLFAVLAAIELAGLAKNKELLTKMLEFAKSYGK